MAVGAPARPPVFNLPNQLTTARLGLAIVLFVLIAYELWLACFLIFALAAFTDWLDGYLARKQNLTSSLGRQLDPLVDKVLICGAYIFLQRTPHSGLEPWMVTVVVARELIITGLRGYLESRGAVFGADWLGKIKMGLQCAALLVIFGVFKILEMQWAEGHEQALYGLRDVLLYITVGITALSGIQYLWRAAGFLKDE
jgi:CDP-diacylglycerol--glycerol-3-phosphate 3-phosphatidyltransferase